MSGSAIRANIVAAAACEAVLRDNRTGDPPDDRAVRWALHETFNPAEPLVPCRSGDGGQDREYG
jgi:hypothetical protein